MEFFDTADYAQHRLGGSFFIDNKKGKWVSVREARSGPDGTIEVVLRPVGDGRGDLYTAKVSDLDLSPKLGCWVQDGLRCFYLARLPVRRFWKQGVGGRNTAYFDTIGAGRSPSPEHLTRLLPNTTNRTPFFGNVKEAMEALECGFTSVELTPDFCLLYSSGQTLMSYRTRGIVAAVFPDLSVSFKSPYHYLTDLCRDSLGHSFNAISVENKL